MTPELDTANLIGYDNTYDITLHIIYIHTRTITNTWVFFKSICLLGTSVLFPVKFGQVFWSLSGETSHATTLHFQQIWWSFFSLCQIDIDLGMNMEYVNLDLVV